jgi:hypothetical protein
MGPGFIQHQPAAFNGIRVRFDVDDCISAEAAGKRQPVRGSANGDDLRSSGVA